MTSESDAPQGNPGDIVNWPMLKIAYRTDPDKIAALLPPGISPGANLGFSPRVKRIVYIIIIEVLVVTLGVSLVILSV